MERVGHITHAHLREMERRGLDPMTAVRKVLDEGRKRSGQHVIINRNGEGYDILATGLPCKTHNN